MIIIHVMPSIKVRELFCLYQFNAAAVAFKEPSVPYPDIIY